MIDSFLSFLGQWGHFIGLGGLAALYLVRIQWLAASLERYSFDVSYYCLKTQQSPEIRQDMAKLWPADRMLFELWRWDFRRYVVDHEQLDHMEAFLAEELSRPSVTMEEIERWVRPPEPSPEPAEEPPPSALPPAAQSTAQPDEPKVGSHDFHD